LVPSFIEWAVEKENIINESNSKMNMERLRLYIGIFSSQYPFCEYTGMEKV